MTTADWFEWGAQAMSNLAQFFAIFLTLTSAYLVMAFVAGKGLSRGQLVLINTFYVLCICFVSGWRTHLAALASDAHDGVHLNLSGHLLWSYQTN